MDLQGIAKIQYATGMFKQIVDGMERSMVDGSREDYYGIYDAALSKLNKGLRDARGWKAIELLSKQKQAKLDVEGDIYAHDNTTQFYMIVNNEGGGDRWE